MKSYLSIEMLVVDASRRFVYSVEEEKTKCVEVMINLEKLSAYRVFNSHSPFAFHHSNPEAKPRALGQ